MTAWTEYVYRWHVAVIHFPIALLLTAAAVELVMVVRRRAVSSTSLLLTCCGAAGALVAAGLGWQLATVTRHPGMDQVVFLHRWSGVASAALAVAAVVAGIFALRSGCLGRRLYRTLLMLTAIAILFTAHYGGALIYGEGYFLPGTSSADIDDDEDL